jgi:TolA-binding protein
MLEHPRFTGGVGTQFMSGRRVGYYIVGFLMCAVVAWSQEVAITADDFQKLDPFEGHVLAQADQTFAAKDYRGAAAAYDAFLVQNPHSVATAYALLRRARSLQLANKRFEAVKAYREVLDYFPNAVAYAAPALYYTGACHFDNGDLESAMKTWTEMAKDAEYRKHYLAAGAIGRLAENLQKQGKLAEGNAYYEQVAVDFRKQNTDVARGAIGKVVWFYVRAQPEMAKLRAFYNAVGTFENDPRPPDDGNFWWRLIEAIRQNGSFQPNEGDARNRYFEYWAGALSGKNAGWDDYQIAVAEFQRMYENDPAKWIERLDKQFQGHQKEGDNARIVKWIQLFSEQKKKVQDYYAKLDFAHMDTRVVIDLLRVSFDNLHDGAMANSVFDKLHLDQMSDEEKVSLARYLWDRNVGFVERLMPTMKDKDRGRMELLRCYHHQRNAPKGLPLATEMTGISAYAKEAQWLKAELLQHQGKLPEAILAYQAADNPPQNLWRIADCYGAMEKRENALAQLREIENFFKPVAPEAAWRIAQIQRDSADRKVYIAALRGLLKKYPNSPQSSAAHLELERLGVKMGGGVDAE